MKNEIGGYFGLEEYSGSIFHEEALKVNTSRNALKIAIKLKGIKKIALPKWHCGTIAEACLYMGTEVRYYDLDEKLRPIGSINEDEWLYVINFYGQLSEDDIISFKLKYDRIIVDNVQNYFQKPVDGIPTLYSCRKYFGVSDGAFLYIDGTEGLKLEKDESGCRMEYVLGRYEKGATSYFDQYKENEEMLSRLEPMEMSLLTENILRSVDYTSIIKIRNDNFDVLERKLAEYNGWKVKKAEGMFMYPFFSEKALDLRSKLIEKKIFIPLLWPDSLDEGYSRYIVPIPIDQRYGREEMEYISDIILGMVK